MKDRLVTFALAIGAFVLFYAFFVPKPANDNQKLELPVSSETGPNGYQAIWRWLQAEQIPVRSLRKRYEGLPEASGNILIATLPQQLPARPAELLQLDGWIERGNTLLVMAALDDTPEWALRSDQGFYTILRRMTRLKFDAIKEEAQESERSAAQTLQQAMQRLLEPQRASMIPKGAHPLFDGVQTVATLSEFPASRWRATTTDSSAILEIGQRADARQGTEAAFWLKRQGEGQIIVCAFASPFSNKLIGDSDNAKLLANILSWSRSAQGAVLFDDAHQGLVDYYDAKAFFADPRLHRTLLWIVLLWLLFVLGWQRLRPQASAWNPIDITTFIKATGGFFAGALTPAAVGQRLFANFFNLVRRRLAQREDGAPVWDWLAAQAGVSAADLAELRLLHAKVEAGKRVDLIRLQNLLSSLSGHFA